MKPKHLIMFKKYILSLTFILASITASAYDFSAPNADGLTLYYNVISDSEVELTEPDTYPSPYTGRVDIPASVNHNGKQYSVTAIGEQTIYVNPNVTEIVIPNSVVRLSSFSITSCENLKSLTIGSSLSEVTGISLFSLPNLETLYYNATSCTESYLIYDLPKLSQVFIGENVKIIPSSFLSLCPSLSSVTIPDNVEEIHYSAFFDCDGIETVYLGRSLKKCSYIFKSCDNIKTLHYNIIDYKVDSANGSDDIKFDVADVIIGDDVISLPNNFFSYNGSLTNLQFGKSVESIGDGAFVNCYNLTDVVIPNSVTSIGASVFSGCSNLTEIVIPNSVISIGAGSFNVCSKLAKIVIGENVKTIGRLSFDTMDALAEVEFNAIDCEILDSFHHAPLLKTVTIGSKVKKFDCQLFYYCFGINAFDVDSNNPYLMSVDGVVYTKDMSTLVKFPMGKVGSYEIPDGVEKIADYAFYSHNKDFKSVSIPASCKSIGTSAFYYNSPLSSIYCYAANPPQIAEDAFESSYYYATLYVPSNVITKYQSATGWRKFSKFDFIRIQPTGISLPETVELLHGNTVQLTATFTPDNATEITTNWSSANSDIASVDQSGKVKGEYPGQTTIYAQCGDLIASCVVTVTPQANRFEADCQTTLINSDIDYPISLVNEKTFASVEFDLSLPTNVSLRVDNHNENFIELSNRAKYHDYSIKYANGKYHISIFSLQRDVITGNEGILFNLPLYVSGDTRRVYLSFSNIKATASDNSTVDLLNLNAPIEITVLQGDANGDKNVTIADFTSVIAYSSNHSVYNFVQSAADVDNNGSIELDDAIAVLDMILEADQSLTDFSSSVTELQKELYTISADNASNPEYLRVHLKNNTSIRDIQFALTLPQGVYIATDDNGYFDITLNEDRANRYRAYCKYIDGVYRIAIASSTVRNIMYDEDWIAEIKLTWGQPQGSVPFKIHNIHISAFDNGYVRDIPVENYTGNVTLDSEGGIDSINADNYVKISTNGLSILIDGIFNHEIVTIFDLSGTCLYSGTDNSILMPCHGIYIVKVRNRTYKIIL